jgi:hypothetical protein
VVLSNPSRRDVKAGKLLTGYAGNFFWSNCLRELKAQECDIRTADTIEEDLLPNTRVILLLGEYAFHFWGGKNYHNYSIHEQRGYLLTIEKWPACHVIASYFPQDCMDVIDFEAKYNPESKSSHQSLDKEEQDDLEVKSRKGRTNRANYRFWLKEDCKKVKKFLLMSKEELAKVPSTENCHYEIYPKASEAIAILMETKGKSLYIDIETDSNYNILCFSFSFVLDIIYTIPLYRYDYCLGYPKEEWSRIIQALVVAMRDNEVVAHNAMFDLFILAWKYRLPVGRKVYDTMLAHHRCWPEAEKSLGHAISHLTLKERYHKDEGIFQPKNAEQEWSLWEYNAKDVSSMILVREALDARAEKYPELKGSIEQGNSMVYPYLVCTMQGIKYNEEKVAKLLEENDIKMNFYLKCLELLVGMEFLPTSPKQCHDYFFHMMKYKIQDRSDTGNPSWSEVALRKLILTLNTHGIKNPVADFCLAYRRLKKESGTLEALPWDHKCYEEYM